MYEKELVQSYIKIVGSEEEVMKQFGISPIRMDDWLEGKHVPFCVLGIMEDDLKFDVEYPEYI